jgi:Zn-dependent protease with chaperone function
MTDISTSGFQACPQCATRIPIDPGYAAWCDNCGWNLYPRRPARTGSSFDRWYEALGHTSSQQLFERVARSASLKPDLNASRVVAFGIATLVHLSTLLFLVIGLVLFAQWPNFFLVTFGLLFITIAWSLRPRIPKAPLGTVARAKFPALHQLVDQVGRELGAPNVGEIVVNGDFNARFGLYGWRRTPTLFLGLPLLTILSPQERVALIAHELAHGVNGDPTRGLVVGSALQSLIEWQHLLRPDLNAPSNQRPRARGTFVFLNLIGNMLAGLLMRALSVIPWTMTYALSHLVWRDSQRAEYQADLLAASVAGTPATLSLLDKLHFDQIVPETVQRVFLSQRDQNVFDDLRARAAGLPPRELERIRRVEVLEGSRLDVTHPPTSHRIAMLRARPAPNARVRLPEEQSQQIDREMATLQPAIQRDMVDVYRRRLYY